MLVQTLEVKKQSPNKKNSFSFRRIFTKQNIHPFDEIKWVKRDAVVGGGEKKVFEQKNVEFPDFWSLNAVNITASKYFRGKLGSSERETSVKQIISRVAKTIREWGEKDGYFSHKEQAQIFEDELIHLLVYQKASFNSPVWFNVGVTEKPQCSACFILSIDDSMSAILNWIRTEGMIFKGGSGSGVNLSSLRSKREFLSRGGRASGPVSFMRGADSVAGMIKSGGTTRRAAKMVILNIDHPDILDFIRCKAEEEKKVRALASAGYDMSDLNNEAWTSIQFQNANNTVRITDDFMKAVEADHEWQTKFITNLEPADTHKARELLAKIAEAAWECGDPGVQFDTTINDWHTCPNSGRINASNPCSEYMHLDNSACNLASINLIKFLKEDGLFATKEFKHAVDILILAQEILVGNSSYPTEKITENANNFRQLGLGYANLGSLLMTKGLFYDSPQGRALAASISSFLTGEAYRFSALISMKKGPFNGYLVNREPMLKVIEKHCLASRSIDAKLVNDKELTSESRHVWDKAFALGEEHGFRNSQVTVLAPTGTIAFMMDCDTTGIEPDFSLIKMKQLVGGGWMKIINAGIENALHRLNYSKNETQKILDWIIKRGTVEGAPNFKKEHLPIFDCAVKAPEGTRYISWQGHVRMVGAVQPFISGAISKTFNMPNETIKEEITEAYMMAWRLGIKAFTVYRDGSKSTQPLQSAQSKDVKDSENKKIGESGVFRRRLPTTRDSETHKFAIAGHEGYLTYSTYEDGSLAEIFIRVAKQGSTLSGLLDSFAISVSMALQYGVPLKAFAHKFIYTRFEPAGFTENSDIRIATSIVDYIFRYLAIRFLTEQELAEFGMVPAHHETKKVKERIVPPLLEEKEIEINSVQDVPKNSKERTVLADIACRKCGGMMVRTGSCLTCLQCGESSGGCS
ncbi:MAG: vitamin B12-dependent ribonucleotide reductase [Patescibacteria group bacterium]|nr:vitamin B12-dependent ribonucleotide reductase [Patescibacteria group bacterium]